MSFAFQKAVREHLPKVTLVFDRFHNMKLLNEKLTELRRLLFAEAAGPLGKNVLKRIRSLLLKKPENLDDSKDERRRLNEAIELNRPLATAYCLKDDLRRFWEQSDIVDAFEFLDDWCARASNIDILKKFAHTLVGHRSGLLAWYRHPISTGPLEGINNKIKFMQRRACGYRELELFKLRIYSIHATRFELVG